MKLFKFTLAYVLMCKWKFYLRVIDIVPWDSAGYTHGKKHLRIVQTTTFRMNYLGAGRDDRGFVPRLVSIARFVRFHWTNEESRACEWNRGKSFFIFPPWPSRGTPGTISAKYIHLVMIIFTNGNGVARHETLLSSKRAISVSFSVPSTQTCVNTQALKYLSIYCPKYIQHFPHTGKLIYAKLANRIDVDYSRVKCPIRAHSLFNVRLQLVRPPFFLFLFPWRSRTWSRPMNWSMNHSTAK